ncbi:MAG: aldehyde dehydrogenase family protein [Deltaproteobacteria bacterium]|nr:aldehyde dehydrogenase family protein [Deltaproteobacteria bacterium]
MVSAYALSMRLEAIERLADGLESNSTALQEAAAQDAGFPVRITSMEVDLAVDYLRTMAEEIAWIENGRPYGTVAAIFPYDAPAVMLARLGGAALLTGNRLRFSFSSHTHRTAALLQEICRPLDTLEPVVGKDNRVFGRNCVEDEAIRVLFMSGASAVGEAYRRQHRAFDKLFFAGPGGMPAAVVFKDASVQQASQFIARRAFINGGQYCTTIKKALIHRSLYEAVRNQILGHVRSLKVGDPLDPETDIGPIRVERTRVILEKALDNIPAARLLTGAVKDETVFPLVLEMDNGEIPDLELFGPLLVLKPFDDPEAAVQELIQTRYGFLLAFFGTPPEHGRRLFHQHFGMVHDNPQFFFTPLRLPFGGKKASGWILERRGEEWLERERRGEEWLERDGAFIYSKELVST